jgi:glucose-6-phosphate 1-dehydrogenase
VNMNFFYGSSFGAEVPEAYERLLLDAIEGDSTLYMRKDEIEASWEFIDGITNSAQASGRTGLKSYSAGSQGPLEANKLPEAYGAKWRKL